MTPSVCLSICHKHCSFFVSRWNRAKKSSHFWPSVLCDKTTKRCSSIFTAQCTLVQMRGLGIACRPSVRLFVTLVDCDHIGWKSWKLIARTISPTPSLFVAKRRSTYSQGNMEKFGETRGGIGKKWHAGEQKRQYL